MPTFELRKLIRAEVILKVTYKTLHRPLLKGVAFSKNLGPTGMNVIMADRLRKSVELELEIYFPDSDEPILAKGKVIWQSRCSYVPESGREYYLSGIQFNYMSPEHAIKTSDFVKDILRKKSYNQVKEIITKIENLR
jgi:hypothetical protein